MKEDGISLQMFFDFTNWIRYTEFIIKDVWSLICKISNIEEIFTLIE